MIECPPPPPPDTPTSLARKTLTVWCAAYPRKQIKLPLALAVCGTLPALFLEQEILRTLYLTRAWARREVESMSHNGGQNNETPCSSK